MKYFYRANKQFQILEEKFTEFLQRISHSFNRTEDELDNIFTKIQEDIEVYSMKLENTMSLNNETFQLI